MSAGHCLGDAGGLLLGEVLREAEATLNNSDVAPPGGDTLHS